MVNNTLDQLDNLENVENEAIEVSTSTYTESHRTYRLKNKDRINAANRQYYQDNKERLQAYNREYNRKWYKENKAKVLEQRRLYARKKAGCINPTGETDKTGNCQICNSFTKLVYDHDHATGLHRGWLCVGCNWRLGWYEVCKDGIDRYLKGQSLFQ